ncbi:MAG: AMP-binding protein [Egibacteraceae bacterium]
MPELLAARSRQTQRRIAVIDGGDSVSYEELAEGAYQYAALIRQLKIAPGDRVALLLPRSIEALAVFFAAQFAGAVAVFISDRLRPHQVGYVISDAGASALFTTARLRPLLRDTRLAPNRVIDVGGCTSISSDLAPTRVIGKDLALLAYTSGSTGPPKGVMLTHDALVAGAAIVADYLGMTSADRTIAVLPWSFDYGLNQVLSTLYVGGTVVIQRSAFPPELCRTLIAARVTGMAGVPSLWRLLRQRYSPFLKIQFHDLRYMTNSGGSLPVDLIHDIRRAHPQVDFYLMYGLTEAFRSTYLPPSMVDARPASIGKAIPNTEILVISDEGRRCLPGEVGELVHRGPTVALGYWRDADATARVFRAHPFPSFDAAPTETVVYSGDYVKADHEGYLYYFGRRDEMFKSHGIRVNPSEIEAELLGSGTVVEAVVFSCERDNADPAIVAAVVPTDASCFRPADLFDYCRSELPQHMQPYDIISMSSLPLTPTGKTDRARLRARLVASGTLVDRMMKNQPHDLGSWY